MAENLIEMLQSSLGSSLPGIVSKYLGESETTTRSAMGAAVPALLAGLMQQSSTPSGARQLFATITSPQTDSGLLGNLASTFAGGEKTASLLSQGSGLLSSLFGDKVGSIASAVGSASGMKVSSTTTLLGLVAPALFAFLKRHLTTSKLDAEGFAGLLYDQRDHLRHRLDDRVTSALGFASPAAFLSSVSSGLSGQASAAAGRVADTARDIGSGATRAAGAAYAAAGDALDRTAVPIVRRGWFWGALVAAALLGLWLLQTWMTPLQQTAQNVATGVARAVKSVDLPGGVKIAVTSGGFLDSLTAFLASSDATPGKSFTFDELQFETGSATLTKTSNQQLEHLAAVLKAYGNVSVNVAGYTDNTGDAAANKKLSSDRAASVKQSLVNLGIPASRITDQGFGPEKPIASNDTEEGRAKNRRVELVVMKR
jgi:outer membrane protein OmpA-like peptidoglycan-associated protein